jgi:hypothetical protein
MPFQRPGSRSQSGIPEAAELATSPTQQASAGGGDAAAGTAPGGEPGAAHGTGFNPVAALHDFYGGSARAGATSPHLPSRPSSAEHDDEGVSGGGGGGELLSAADLVDYPYLVDGDPTPAAYLLLACADYLRIYATGAACCREQRAC